MPLLPNQRSTIIALINFSVTVLCAWVLYWAVRVSPVSIATRPWVDMWLEALLCLFVALVAVVAFLPLSTPNKVYLVTGALGLFLFTVLTLVLKNTPYTLGGASGDQALYTTLITKYAAYAGNVDGVYRGLPAFYPSLLYYVLGHLAAILAVEPYRMLKYGTLAVTLLLPFCSVWGWRRIVNPATALTVTFGLLVIQEWYKPAEWVSVVLFVPWWLYWINLVDLAKPEDLKLRSDRVQRWLVGSLIGGVIFQLYYYWFFIGGLYLVFELLVHQLRRTDPGRWYLRNACAVLFGSACVSSLYWAPYLYSMSVTGGWHALQNRWLPDDGILLQFPFLEFSGSGLLMLGGLLFLSLNPSHSRLVQRLLWLLLAAYGWIALGYIGMLTDYPLLTFKTYLLVKQLLLVGALLGLAELWERQTLFAPPTRLYLQRLATAVGLMFLLAFGQATAQGFLQSDLAQRALDEDYPRRLLDIMDTLTQKQYIDKVILMDQRHRDLLAYRPVYSFVASDAHSSNPAGLFHQRADFLIKLAATGNPELLATAFQQNRYSAIDYVLLNRTKDDHAWQFAYSDDDFPYGSITRYLKFTDEQFSVPYFQATTLKDYTLFTPTAQQGALTFAAQSPIASAAPETLALLYALDHSFGVHLKAQALSIDQAQLEQAVAQLDLDKLSLPTLLDLQLAASPTLRAKVNAVLQAKVRHPTDIRLRDAEGIEKLQLIGYDTGTLQPQGGFHLALYFMALSPLTQDYTLTIALARAGKQLDLSCATNTPTSTWQTGGIYRDICTFPLEPGDYQTEFTIQQRVGEGHLWPAKGKDKVDLGIITFP